MKSINNLIVSVCMKKSNGIFYIMFGIMMWMMSSSVCFGQEENVKVITPRTKASPLAISTFLSEDNVYLKTTYGQPFKKGRTIFGNLVPYGEIWRTGANEATEFTNTQDIKVGKKVLKAGTYTIFSIPEEDEWTVIFNSSLGQWGSYKYDEIKAQNVLTIKVPVSKTEDMYEAFTVQFEQNKDGVEMQLLWDMTKVAIPIGFVKK
jgi:hypothetical protein